MSIFGDWGDALSGPFVSFGKTAEKLFTDPSKLTAKEIPTFLLPIPGVGSAITYDLDHPSAAIYQGATLAALAGGANVLSVYGPAAFASGADQAAAASANAELGASMGLFSTSAPSAASLIAADFGPAAAPNAAALVAGDFGPGPVNAALSLNASAAAAAPGASKAATVAAAAAAPSAVKSAIGGFLQNVKDAGPIAATLALLQGGKPGGGAGVNGGSNPPINAAGIPIPIPAPVGQGSQQASAAGSRTGLMLMAAAAAAVGVWWFKRRKS